MWFLSPFFALVTLCIILSCVDGLVEIGYIYIYQKYYSRLIRGCIGKELDSVLVERIVTSFKHVRLHYEAGGRPFPFNGEPISQASCPSFLWLGVNDLKPILPCSRIFYRFPWQPATVPANKILQRLEFIRFRIWSRFPLSCDVRHRRRWLSFCFHHRLSVDGWILSWNIKFVKIVSRSASILNVCLMYVVMICILDSKFYG